MALKPKRENCGPVEINFSFSRHLGPRFEQGSVRLQFDGSQPYSFSSSAEWPDTVNYDANVKAGVEKALKEIQGSLETTKIELLAIDFDVIDSTPHGFENAAYAATCAAFLT